MFSKYFMITIVLALISVRLFLAQEPDEPEDETLPALRSEHPDDNEATTIVDAELPEINYKPPNNLGFAEGPNTTKPGGGSMSLTVNGGLLAGSLLVMVFVGRICAC